MQNVSHNFLSNAIFNRRNETILFDAYNKKYKYIIVKKKLNLKKKKKKLITI